MSRQIAWNAVGWIALAAYSFVTSTIIFRTTGQADYGIWATIAAFRSLLLVLDAGLAFGATRDASLFATGDDIARHRWRAALLLYLAGALITLVLAALFAGVPGALLDIGPRAVETGWVTALIGVEAAVALACGPVLAGLRGTGRFDLLAGSSLVTAVVGSSLLVALTPPLGLLGAAVAVVIARLSGALFAAVSLQFASPGLAGTEVEGRYLRAVTRFALPLWAVAIGAAIGMATDVPVVGVIFGAEAAGAYGIGAVVPSVVAGFIFVLLDTAFPRLTTLALASLGHVVRMLATVGALVAGIGFGSLILSAQDVLSVWLGETTGLTATALIAYAFVWLLNVPTHVLVLGAIARDRHGVIGPIVLAEAIANVAVSVFLAFVIGPIGPAIATVLTVGISNMMILPLMLGPRVGIEPLRLLVPSVGAAAVGIVIATMARAFGLLFDDAMARVVVNAGLALLAIAALGATVISRRTAVQRWMGIIFDGGWRLLQAERVERAVMAPIIAATPQILLSTESPLVTIRIATYNRGPLVAERAIASALAQTYRNIEVVVIGDNCDAATERAVTAVRDPRVRFENLPQRGTYPSDPMFRWMVAGAAPMNRALTMARGDWLAPLDDDDEFTPDHVEILLDTCRSRNVDVAYGVAEMEVRPAQWQRVGSWPPEPGSIIHAAVLYSLRLRPMRHNVEAWRLNEPGDWNLWRRMMAAGAMFAFVDRVVVRHYLEYREVLAQATP